MLCMYHIYVSNQYDIINPTPTLNVLMNIYVSNKGCQFSLEYYYNTIFSPLPEIYKRSLKLSQNRILENLLILIINLLEQFTLVLMRVESVNQIEAIITDTTQS